MADINIDTSDPQYVQLLNGLGTLRTLLGPRVKMLIRLRNHDRRNGTELVRAWLQRDPLLRRTLKIAQSLDKFIGEEVAE